MDIKGQAVRGANAGDWDQRKSTGEFRGAPDGLNIATLVEFRAEGELADILTNPDRLQEFVQPGDNMLTIINRFMNTVTEHQPDAFGHAASLLHLGGSGQVGFNFFAYDND